MSKAFDAETGRLGSDPSPETLEKMLRVPKVDLHRHLEGAFYPDFVFELAQRHRIPIPAQSIEELTPLIQVTEKDRTLLDFIAKFDTLALLFQNREIIKELTYKAIFCARRDQIRYVEFRFAPTYMGSRTGLDPYEIVEGVLEGREDALKDAPDMKIGFILIVNREAPLETAKKMLALAEAYQSYGIVGMDLAGDELHYPPEAFAEIFQQAREAGLFVTLHAGEARGAESVEAAVKRCRAQRIGHGVRIAGNARVEEMVIRENVFLEICPTSNVQTGAVSRWNEHPLCSFLERKIPITINTDDPGVSGITLTHEYARLHDLYEIPIETIQAICLSGVDAAFLPEAEKRQLKNKIAEEWKRLSL